MQYLITPHVVLLFVTLTGRLKYKKKVGPPTDLNNNRSINNRAMVNIADVYIKVIVCRLPLLSLQQSEVKLV